MNPYYKVQKLFNQIADRIEADPESYDQDIWGYTEPQRSVDYEDLDYRKAEILEQDCGTSHCIAGWAAVLSGYKPSITSYEESLNKFVIEVDWSHVKKDLEPGRATCAVGREVLGLSMQDADVLFSEFWKPEQVTGDSTRDVIDALRRLADGHSVDDVTHIEDPTF